MLLILGILFALAAAVVFVLIAWANGMSDSSERMSSWPAVVLALVGVLIFVARWFLHGQAITW